MATSTKKYSSSKNCCDWSIRTQKIDCNRNARRSNVSFQGTNHFSKVLGSQQSNILERPMIFLKNIFNLQFREWKRKSLLLLWTSCNHICHWLTTLWNYSCIYWDTKFRRFIILEVRYKSSRLRYNMLQQIFTNYARTTVTISGDF